MSRRPKLLIEEPPLQVLPSLAVRIGLNEAIVLQQLHYLTGRETAAPDLKQSEWCEEHFPFWSKETVKRTFRRLRDLGLITTEQPRGGDRRNRIRVNYDRLAALEEPADRARGQSDPLVNLTPPTGQSDPSPSTRAQEDRQKEELQEPPEPPASGGRRRDRDRFEDDCKAYAAEHFPDLGEQGPTAVGQAARNDCRTHAEVAAFIDRWWRKGAAA